MSKKVLVGLFFGIALLIAAVWYLSPQAHNYSPETVCKDAIVYIRMENSMVVEIEGQEVCSALWEVRPKAVGGN